MDAKELRIGNLILKDGEEIIVSSYTFYNVEKDEDSYEPIPLTEEWLLKFGFKKVKIQNSFVYNILWFIIFNNWTGEGFDTYTYSTYHVSIKYVHQIQNLYFALAGQELTYV